MKVLIADDEERHAKMCVTLLQHEKVDIDPLFCEKAEHILEMVQTFRPDVVLLDLVFPGSSPEQIIAIICRLSEISRVIVFSGYDSWADVCMKEGAVDFLYKPAWALPSAAPFLAHALWRATRIRT
jgi:DNA-binding NtrC family response regulator